MLAFLTAREVLTRAVAFGIDIYLKDGRLLVRAPGHIPPSMADYIRKNRTEIVAQFQELSGCYSCILYPCAGRVAETTLCTGYKPKVPER